MFLSVEYYARHPSSSSSCLVQAPLSLSSLSISLSRLFLYIVGLFCLYSRPLFLPLLLPLVLNRCVVDLRSEQSLSLSLPPSPSSLSLSIYRATLKGLHALKCGHVTCVLPHTPLTVWMRKGIPTCVRTLRVFSPTHAALPDTRLTTDTANMHTYLQYIYRRVYACVRACVCLCVVIYNIYMF